MRFIPVADSKSIPIYDNIFNEKTPTSTPLASNTQYNLLPNCKRYSSYSNYSSPVHVSHSRSTSIDITYQRLEPTDPTTVARIRLLPTFLKQDDLLTPNFSSVSSIPKLIETLPKPIYKKNVFQSKDNNRVSFDRTSSNLAVKHFSSDRRIQYVPPMEEKCIKGKSIEARCHYTNPLNYSYVSPKNYRDMSQEMRVIRTKTIETIYSKGKLCNSNSSQKEEKMSQMENIPGNPKLWKLRPSAKSTPAESNLELLREKNFDTSNQRLTGIDQNNGDSTQRSKDLKQNKAETPSKKIIKLEIVDKTFTELERENKKEAELEKLDKKETELERADKKETKLEKEDKKEAELEKLDKKETKLEKLDKKETELEKLDKKETELEKLDKKETELEKLDKKETELKKLDKKETEHEREDKKETELGIVNEKETELEVVNKEETELEVVKKEETELEVVKKEETELEVVKKEETELEVVKKEETELEVVKKEETELQIVEKEEMKLEKVETKESELNKIEIQPPEFKNIEIKNTESASEQKKSTESELIKEITNKEGLGKKSLVNSTIIEPMPGKLELVEDETGFNIPVEIGNQKLSKAVSFESSGSDSMESSVNSKESDNPNNLEDVSQNSCTLEGKEVDRFSLKKNDSGSTQLVTISSDASFENTITTFPNNKPKCEESAETTFFEKKNSSKTFKSSKKKRKKSKKNSLSSEDAKILKNNASKISSKKPKKINNVKLIKSAALELVTISKKKSPFMKCNSLPLYICSEKNDETNQPAANTFACKKEVLLINFS